MEDLNQFVPNVHFEKIPIKNLVSNQKYQRNLSQSHIARAAANFDLYQINPVKVSRRDGVIVSYLAGGLSRMSGITTGECSGIAAARSSDLEMDLCSLFHLSHSVVLPLIWF